MERLRYLRLTGRQKVLVWCTFLLAALGALTAAVVLHMRPIVVDLATARTSNMVNRIVVAAINDAVDSGRIDYGRLVSFDKDANGHVTALKSNMAEFNRLQSAIIDEVLITGMANIAPADLKIIKGVAAEYVRDIFRRLREHGYDENTMTLYVTGGGGCLVKNFYEFSADRVKFVEDICAAAKGYEYLAEAQMKAEAKK